MPPERQRAYAWIVYRAFVDIRMSASGALPARPWSPAWWRRAATSLRRIESISDALHNLPDFMARDFAGFDEDFFWKSFVDVAVASDPTTSMRHYRDEFESFIQRESPGGPQ